MTSFNTVTPGQINCSLSSRQMD